jgi:dTDP-4-amino-4,6-dideoxygalactose transaminase
MSHTNLEMIFGNQAKKEIEKELKAGGCEVQLNQKEDATANLVTGGRADSTPSPNCERLQARLLIVMTERDLVRADLDRISEALERALEAMK